MDPLAIAELRLECPYIEVPLGCPAPATAGGAGVRATRCRG